MKYSDAIELGATLAPQAFATMKDARGGTCANGAALAAVGVNADTAPRSYVWEHFPEAGSEFIKDMPYATAGLRLKYYVEILNDELRWSRPRIAQWIREHIDALPQRQEQQVSA